MRCNDEKKSLVITCFSATCRVENRLMNESSLCNVGFDVFIVDEMALDSCTVVLSFIHLWLLLLLQKSKDKNKKKRINANRLTETSARVSLELTFRCYFFIPYLYTLRLYTSVSLYIVQDPVEVFQKCYKSWKKCREQCFVAGEEHIGRDHIDVP